jgi:hypothetical protein
MSIDEDDNESSCIEEVSMDMSSMSVSNLFLGDVSMEVADNDSDTSSEKALEVLSSRNETALEDCGSNTPSENGVEDSLHTINNHSDEGTVISMGRMNCSHFSNNSWHLSVDESKDISQPGSPLQKNDNESQEDSQEGLTSSKEVSDARVCRSLQLDLEASTFPEMADHLEEMPMDTSGINDNRVLGTSLVFDLEEFINDELVSEDVSATPLLQSQQAHIHALTPPGMPTIHLDGVARRDTCRINLNHHLQSSRVYAVQDLGNDDEQIVHIPASITVTSRRQSGARPGDPRGDVPIMARQGTSGRPGDGRGDVPATVEGTSRRRSGGRPGDGRGDVKATVGGMFPRRSGMFLD